MDALQDATPLDISGGGSKSFLGNAGQRDADRCQRSSRYRGLRSARTGADGAQRHDAASDRSRAGRSQSDARIRTSAFRQQRHAGRNHRLRTIRTAPPLQRIGARFCFGLQDAERPRRNTGLRRTGDEERRGLRCLAPDGGRLRHAGHHARDQPESAAAPAGQHHRYAAYAARQRLSRA